MAALTGTQVSRLQSALLDAFSFAELTQLARTCLEINLEIASTDSSLGGTAFKLIEWAQRHDRVRDLIRCAATARPGNDVLRALNQELGFKLQPGQPASSQTQSSRMYSRAEGNDGAGWSGVHIAGSVYVSGDFVGRDQYKYGANELVDAHRLFGTLKVEITKIAPPGQLSSCLACIDAIEAEIIKWGNESDERIAHQIEELAAVLPLSIPLVQETFQASLLAQHTLPATKYVLKKLNS